MTTSEVIASSTPFFFLVESLWLGQGNPDAPSPTVHTRHQRIIGCTQ